MDLSLEWFKGESARISSCCIFDLNGSLRDLVGGHDAVVAVDWFGCSRKNITATTIVLY